MFIWSDFCLSFLKSIRIHLELYNSQINAKCEIIPWSEIITHFIENNRIKNVNNDLVFLPRV